MFNATKAEIKKIGDLKVALRDVQPLPDEPDFFKNDETLLRYLRSRDLKMSDAEKMIRFSIEWRRQNHPLSVTCDSCLNHPGAHSFRMIGFDDFRRPVLYSSFNQASKVSVGHGDVNQHLIYVMENAIRTMVPGVNQWIIVFDCSGMSVASCNPKLGRECTQLLSLHYPERLAHALCIRPGSAFKTALVAMKTFMPPVTAKKVHLIKYEDDDQLQKSLQKYISQDLAKWLVKEVSLNGKKKITPAQRTFWQYNAEAGHDPRGTAEYVTEYVEQEHPCGHRPHGNIQQALSGRRLQWSRSKMDDAAAWNEEADDDEGHTSASATNNHVEENLGDIWNDKSDEKTTEEQPAEPNNKPGFFTSFFSGRK